MTKVLITDCNSRKALCAVRSLGQEGYTVFAISDKRINESRFSRYCSGFHQVPSVINQPSEFLHRTNVLTNELEIDIIVPMEDETVELIINNKDYFNTINKLLPDSDVFDIARDKGKTIKKAEELGVSIPKTYHPINIIDVKKISEKVAYPAVIKPRISSGSRGISYVNNSQELIEEYNQINGEFKLPLIQQFLSNKYKKIQVLMILDHKSNVKASCTYEGVREFPVDGGPVTFWRTISSPHIEDKTIKLLEGISWVGFAEVEYVVDHETGDYYLMEINPRFSANIALAVSVGVDFPMFYAKLSKAEEVASRMNDKFSYYCQWFLPGDLLNFIFNKHRFSQEFGYFFSKPKNLSYAVLSKKDPLPSLVTLVSLLLNSTSNLKNLKSKLKARR